MTSKSKTRAEHMATWYSGNVTCMFYKVTDKKSSKVLRYSLIGGDPADQGADFVATFSTSVEEPDAKGNVRELILAFQCAPEAVRRVIVACGWQW